jgi:hypothetical protein
MTTMVAIPTNARTAIRATVPVGVEVQSWSIEFVPSEPDLVRLYSVDGDPTLILVETHESAGALRLDCAIGPHGTPASNSGSISLDIVEGADAPSDLVIDVR